MDTMLTIHVFVAFWWGFLGGLTLDRWILPALVDLSARWRRHGRR